MVPLNTRLALPELLYMVEHAEVKVLLFDDANLENYIEIKKQAANIAHFIYMGDQDIPEGAHGYEKLIEENSPAPDAGRGMDELLGIYYTGGTTGLPKGVMLSHGNLSINVMCQITDFGFVKDAHYLHVTPMFHLADVIPTYTLTILTGTHHFFPVFDIDLLLKTIQISVQGRGFHVPFTTCCLAHHRNYLPNVCGLSVIAPSRQGVKLTDCPVATFLQLVRINFVPGYFVLEHHLEVVKVDPQAEHPKKPLVVAVLDKKVIDVGCRQGECPLYIRCSVLG